MLFIIVLIVLLSYPPYGYSTAVVPEEPSYWIWSGIDLPSGHEEKNLFLYQGVFSKNDTFMRRGLYPHRLNAKRIYLVFRLEAINKQEAVFNTIMHVVSRWEQKRLSISGIQLDFDCPTLKLADYSAFLNGFRAMLPPEYRLSITGLGDWLSSAPAADLKRLIWCADDIVFQLYAGPKYVENISEYISRLRKFRHAFRVGLLDGSTENESILQTLRTNPNFGGCIYFIYNHKEEHA